MYAVADGKAGDMHGVLGALGCTRSTWTTTCTGAHHNLAKGYTKKRTNHAIGNVLAKGYTKNRTKSCVWAMNWRKGIRKNVQNHAIGNNLAKFIRKNVQNDAIGNDRPTIWQNVYWILIRESLI